MNPRFELPGLRRLFAPIDIAWLVYFRIVFGAIMLWEVCRYFNRGWIEKYFIDPTRGDDHAWPLLPPGSGALLPGLHPVVLLLLWRPTRLWAFALATLIYFPPHWPRLFVNFPRPGAHPAVPVAPAGPFRPAQRLQAGLLLL